MLWTENYEILVCPHSLQIQRRTHIILNREFPGLCCTKSRFIEGLRMIIIIVSRRCCGIPAAHNMIFEKFADFKHFLLLLLTRRSDILILNHAHTLTPLHGSFSTLSTTARNIIQDLTLQKHKSRGWNAACIHRLSYFFNPPLTHLPSRRSNWVTSNNLARDYSIIWNNWLWIKVPRIYRHIIIRIIILFQLVWWHLLCVTLRWQQPFTLIPH